MEKTRLAWWEDACKRYLNSKYRQDKEYGGYLDRWLHDTEESVDGAPWEIRIKFREPMPFNVYMYE